jgi:hypothetical protein
MKIRLVGAEFSVQTDRETDRQRRDEANSHFSQFCEQVKI